MKTGTEEVPVKKTAGKLLVRFPNPRLKMDGF